MRIVIRSKNVVTLTRDIYTAAEVIEMAALCDTKEGETVAVVDGDVERLVIAKVCPIVGTITLTTLA